ncbi:sulfotransferase [Roseovarius sp. S4756]|uniref:sulfotransferase n=1 Tax=Roseovarius maritimus TaxID=3342637 RepID=UPI0037277DCB
MINKLFGNLFISAGAMKAGTTWLYAVLERHPELHFTPEKEIHYFHYLYADKSVLSEERRLELAKTRYLERFDPARANIDRVRCNLHWVTNYLDRPVDDFWYRNLFTLARQEKWSCDFSNFYALLPQEAWPKIASKCDDLKVLYTLRDPIKRLWSHTKFHLQVSGQLEALDSWGPKEFETFVRKPFMWKNAEYGAALRRMKAGLPEGALKTVFFEDIRQRPREVLGEIGTFLGLAPHSYPDALIDRRVNESVSRPMPDFFPELFEKDVARIRTEVEAEGLDLPASWSA